MPEDFSQKTAIIFSDGASRGNPGPGGFAAVAVIGEKVVEIGGKEDHTTNNRMELKGALEALKKINNLQPNIQRPEKVSVFSDSSYLVKGMTSWVNNWQKNGWLTSLKEPVENQDLWQELMEIGRQFNVEWKLIGGHVGVAGNERCDQIATAFADGKVPDLYSGSRADYPVKNILSFKSDQKKIFQKSSVKARKNSRGVAYSYVSLLDGKIKVHKNWAECEERVKGKNARFKKALTVSEEKEIIAEFSR